MSKKDETEEQGIVVLEKQFSMVPRNLTEAMDFAKLIAESEVCPKDYRKKPGDILIAVQMGSELGLQPIQAIQNIAVINQRPTVWGDALIGIVKASGLVEYIKERDHEEAWKKKEGRCEVKRKGSPEATVRTFSYESAERAGLVERSKGKYGDGPWITYPGRMLQMRARAFALRDEFADVLRGLQIREEVEDYPAERGTATIQMPRQLPEHQTAEVDEFLSEQGAAPAGASTKPSEAESSVETTIDSIEVKTGKKKDGSTWTRYGIKCGDGKIYGTFSKTVADAAKAFDGTGEIVTLWCTDDGKYQTATGVVPLGGPED